jgi:alpha-pyrone synthase
MSLALHAIGTATPPRQIAQADAATLAIDFANAEPGRERTLAAIYRQTKIRTRGSVLLDEPGDAAYAQDFFLPATHGDDAGPTTAERMDRYAREAGPLAIRAARSAVAEAGVAADTVTHLVTCSCTGCHGAFNALRVAYAFTTADPAAVVLVVCVELCSLHFQYGTRSDHVVANSIFADGAAAIVATAQARGAQEQWRLLGQRSQVLPASSDQMGWIIGDHGFEMTLSPRVPDAIAAHLPAAVDALLRSQGLERSDVASWAVHPGGPRILAAVAETLGLADQSLRHSRGVLADHGNMSSATILFILERLAAEGSPGPCVAMAFGPGLTAELALFATNYSR